MLIDNGTTCCFMTRKFQLQHKLLIRRKEQAWEMTTINGKPIDELIYLETLLLQMNFEHHLKNIIFDIYPEGAYDIILGIPWLRAHNPEISWDTEDIDFTQCRCSRVISACEFPHFLIHASSIYMGSQHVIMMS